MPEPCEHDWEPEDLDLDYPRITLQARCRRCPMRVYASPYVVTTVGLKVERGRPPADDMGLVHEGHTVITDRGLEIMNARLGPVEPHYLTNRSGIDR